MLSRSGSTPRFRSCTIVCTALSEEPFQGLVHRVVTHTTHPELGPVQYVLERSPLDPIRPRTSTDRMA